MMKEYFIITIDEDSSESEEEEQQPEKFSCPHQNCVTCHCTENEARESEQIPCCHLSFDYDEYRCVNRAHKKWTHETQFVVSKPFWPHSCFCPFDSELKAQLIRLCDILNLKCTCTARTVCKLCASLTLGYATSYLVINEYQRISLTNLMKLLPFLNMKKSQ